MRYHGSSCHNGIVAYGYARKNCGIRPDPHIAAERDWRWIGVAAVFGRKAMVKRGKHHIMSYLATIAKCHPTMILKVTTRIYKHPFTYGDILAEIGVKWRKYPERIGHTVAEKLRKQLAYLIGCIISRIKFEGYTPRLITHLVHEAQYFLGVKCLACFYSLFEFFYSHVY